MSRSKTQREPPATRYNNIMGPKREDRDVAAAGHDMIVPFDEGRKRSSCPNVVQKNSASTARPCSSPRRRLTDARTPPMRGLQNQISGGSCRRRSRKKENKATSRQDLIVGFPERNKPDTRLGTFFSRNHEAQREASRNRKPPREQALSASQRSESSGVSHQDRRQSHRSSTEDWRQSSIVWGDDEDSDDDDPMNTGEFIDTSASRFSQSDTSLLSQSFKSLLSTRKPDP